jgi:hypothetical protein
MQWQKKSSFMVVYMIKSITLEQGEIYIDKKGQCRQVMKLLKFVVKFRLVRNGSCKYPALKMEPGDCRWMSRNQFCEWAKGKV